MKKTFTLILLSLLTATSFFQTQTYADIWGIKIEIKWETTTWDIHRNTVDREEIFNYYANFFREQTLPSYKYIDLQFRDVEKWTKLYDSLQVLVFFWVIENKKTSITPEKNLNAYGFYILSEQVLGIELLQPNDEKRLSKRDASMNDMIYIKNKFNRELETLKNIHGNKDIETKKAIFEDVYDTLRKQHYDKDTNTEVELLESAIKWLTDGTNDKHTTYFPPVDTTDFKQSLSGEFEWIGAYVEMQQPGVFKIISPIKWSPAYKAWLKWGDRVTHVDGKEITETDSSNEVVSWIKGPKWTEVILTIQRGSDTFDLPVTRDKIVIKDLEYEMVNTNTFYINIKNFGPNVSTQFVEALKELEDKKHVTKVIIDVRNNWGWYLDQVADMLSYMVPENEPTAVIKYLSGDRVLKSAWYNIVDFDDYTIVLLQNSGTASASEILVGTIKDYYPEAITIWEQSYWKGSVQQMKEYKDGSLLKFTVAKWYTGGEQRGIDGVWLTPDIELELDMDQYKKFDIDNQYNKALRVK